ncbi:hypothetical protein MATL_G00218940 [Megalops atlanticus]|uniref:BAH domain-containing protein n=1 Tax=Megalops atlanticus TaxID=7932 RepID=A0A9D3SXI2_MEGAT|nr:hypothetical protein MATL_G00218940 [Megalops atlanticus]
MELLSELAELERQQHHHSISQGEELLTFDLQSLATLAAARALELDAPEGMGEGAERHCPVRRTLNLRRKCSWTPRHEPVCRVKGAMETMDGQELAMRVRLAELQRRYKEKQRELAKLQRKHEHQKEETPRSPARRGPGRPRKRKSIPGPVPSAVAPADSPRRVKSSLGGLGLLPDDLRGGGEVQRKRKKLSNGSFDQLSTAQMKARCCKQGSRQVVLGSKLAQFKQRAKPAVVPAFRRRGAAVSGAGPARLCQGQRGSKAERRHGMESGGQSDTEEDDDECSYDSEEGQGDIRPPPSRDTSSSSAVTGPSPSSIVKLEANQKARNKKERQGLHGSHSLPGTEGEVKVKVRKSALCRPTALTAARRSAESQEPQGGRRTRRPKATPRQPLWGRPGPGGGPYRRRAGLGTPSTVSERLMRATRKSTALRGAPGTVRRQSRWVSRVPSPSSEDNSGTRRSRSKQPKGRAVSRLLESFAADEGFQMDEDGSFSEGEGDSSQSGRLAPAHHSSPAAPDCVLTKERLVDGLKVLISKEDELLYAACVHTLEIPDIYSVVIDGERGNRPRIYSLEQLLQEAVLDVRPETEAVLTAGTRVCAYWSERSRCLYPGYVRRGGPGEEGKEGSVMVEFDDGDRGRISLHNIRLLPPDYQIHCAEPSPALLVSSGRRGRRSSALERVTSSDASSERPEPEPTQTPENRPVVKARRGRPKGSGKKAPVPDSVKKTAAPLFSWPAMAVPKKRTPHDLFQLNGTPRKTLKGKESEPLPLVPAPIAPQAKAIFSSSFEVDSFSSIANGYSSFGGPAGSMPLVPSGAPCSRGRRPGEGGIPRGRKAGAEFLVKLDHEGVTAPKTKNSKALLLLGSSGQGNRVDKGFGSRGPGGRDVSRPGGYSHPVLLVKDSKSGDGTRVELLLKGASQLQKPAPAMSLGEYGEFGMNCHSDCHSSYSDLDEEEEEEEEEEERRAALAAAAAASGGLRTAGRFLSRLSVSSSSSGSSSSSSSGSLSSSSLCSSENDSSYSSEDEESSTLLLQGCLSSHHALLQPPEPPPAAPPPPQRAFVAKAVAVTSPKGGAGGHSGHGANGKLLKRKACPAPPSRPPRESEEPEEPPKRQRLPAVGHQPKISSFLPARQLWRWSGNPTQRRGTKGKARKLFYKAIVRGRDTVRVGDCAVFLSAGRPHLPYVGRIESFWESWANMVVKVKWFYHPEETKMGKRHRDGKHALYQSCHEDENDVQTISHRCQVVSRAEYEHLSRDRKHSGGGQDLYYLAGTYDPTSGQLVNADGVSIIC